MYVCVKDSIFEDPKTIAFGLSKTKTRCLEKVKKDLANELVKKADSLPKSKNTQGMRYASLAIYVLPIIKFKYIISI